jgi:hypothetical protein
MVDHLGLAPADRSAANASEERYKIDDYCPYLVALLMDVRSLLLKRLKAYLAEQVAWIQQQKGDPKKAGVQGPVARFPSLVRQAMEMTGGQVRVRISLGVRVRVRGSLTRTSRLLSS